MLTLRGRGPRRGSSLSNLGLIKDGALLVRDGVIGAVGTRAQVEALPEARVAEKLDLGGRVALPGFVDSHTHLIHAASRAEEYELKIEGASYEEIARKGGGILNSVKKLRAATAEALKKRAMAALNLFAAYGTTTVEAKSGYGLDVASELKIWAYTKNWRTAPGHRVYLFGCACGARGVSREAERSGEIHRAADRKDDAGGGREKAGGILRRILRPRSFHAGAIQAHS